MLESVGDDAVDGDADNDVDVGDADDDAVAGPGSCGSSCWVPSSREHTGPRNQVSPVPRAAGGTRLHVDETTPIDRYPRSIRAPGGVPLHGGQRCSRDSQGHGVTCHEDIPINQELPSRGASRHAESGYVSLFFQDRSCPIVPRTRNTLAVRYLLNGLGILSLAILISSSHSLHTTPLVRVLVAKKPTTLWYRSTILPSKAKRCLVQATLREHPIREQRRNLANATGARPQPSRGT